MNRPRILVFGYHDVGYECLEALIARGDNVIGVFTHHDDPGERIWFRSVRELAERNNIAVHTPDSVNTPEWLDRIGAMKPDLIFSFYYRHMISRKVLDIPRLGAFNMHGSLLPKYRGRAPVNWAILSGETETGVTLHHMVARADAGDIVDQQAVSIGPEDTALDVFRKIAPAARRLLERRIDSLKNGTAPRIAQDEREATYYGGRKPEDGKIDWTKNAEAVCNLVRAVAYPFPGAFTSAGGKRLFVWEAKPLRGASGVPGQVLATQPLRIAAGEGVVEIRKLQWEGGAEENGASDTHGLRTGALLGIERELAAPGTASASEEGAIVWPSREAQKKVLILGVNGFIGSSLAEYILKNKDWTVFGMDVLSDKLEDCMDHRRFQFVEGDITINREWIEYHIKKCDVVIPLVAIATPAVYVKDPLRVFELDFEANLGIVRKCLRYKKRLIFPSTSEVYGMCSDREFDEESSSLVLGPINKHRWIYSCSKQLLDRVIHAYGLQEGLQYTLFRPFNWIGPKLDNILEPKEGSSRVLTQFIGNVLRGRDIHLVDGGMQRRSFTYIDDGVDALIRIIENKDGCADRRIFNIGNPGNDVTIRELAELLIELVKIYPSYARIAERVKAVPVQSEQYYGEGYQDILSRVPSIRNAEKHLGWKPHTDLRTALRKTLDYYLARLSPPLTEREQQWTKKAEKYPAHASQ